MAEGWIRRLAEGRGLDVEVWSAGTERTRVRPDAITVMAEAGIDISGHSSKRLDEVHDPWRFDVVLTVCDDANESCPAYPAETIRLHVAVPDPSGEPLARWREVRDAVRTLSSELVDSLASGAPPDEASLRRALAASGLHSDG
jgi:arsenate reductase (thioredoxin)